MLKTINIENYKSIEKLTLSLGRVNVLIGENGAGKSNLLEAIALAGAAQADKLDNEFLTSRGIRVTAPQLMRSAFKARNTTEPIKVSVHLANKSEFSYELSNDNKPYSAWHVSMHHAPRGNVEPIGKWIGELFASLPNDEERKKLSQKLAALAKGERDEDGGYSLKIEVPSDISPPKLSAGGMEDFIVYTPENSALRTFEKEGQIEPLGINGEGLLKLLRVMSEDSGSKRATKQIKDALKLFGWFKDFRIARGALDDRIDLVDRFLDNANPTFDQRSANEGFLYLAFYLALFTSKLTPRFFAIDNVDASLNPKMCEALMQRLAALAEAHDKQVILTTHNPALLDGLDLSDPEHRLFIVTRGPRGQTRVRQFERKPTSEKPRRLSELFLSGALGGLPKGF